MAPGLPGMDRPRIQGRNDSPPTHRPVIGRCIMRTQEILGLLVVVTALTLCLPQMASAEDPVRFGDANLKAAVEAELGKTDPTPNDMLALTRLHAEARKIADLRGIEYATNLTELWLAGNQITNLSPLVGLTRLTALGLQDNPLNGDACAVHIPRILADNPGVRLHYDACVNRCRLTVSSMEGGTVTKPGIGSFAYERGSTVPVEATPNPGYRFARWTGTIVDRKDIADPRLSLTRVVLHEGGTVRASFELLRLFHESWETATIGTYEPTRAQLITGDEGVWFPEDAVSQSPVCGPTPQKAEILKLDGGQALLLTSSDSRSGCSDIMSASLTEAALVNPGFAVAVDANTVVSFYEVGQLDHPESHESGNDCRIAPCFDNVSLLLSDNKGNVLAYVLQRSAEAVANTPNANFGNTYREVFLDSTGLYYQRNLFRDLQTIPAFDPIGAQVRSIEFRVDEHGSAMIDDIIIGPGITDGAVPVYRFWSPVLESHFFTTGADEKQTLIDLFSGVWTFEGIAYFTLGDASNPGTVPVYRFWSPALSSHFYTISEEEKSALLKDFPDIWTLEGVAFYGFPEGRQPADACPVYRFWSGTMGCHFYTISEAERDNLVSNFPQVWTLEGVAWYAYPPQWDSGQALGIVRNGRTSKNP